MPTLTLGELSRAIGARLEGDAAAEVSGAAGLDQAGPADLSFLSNPRYREAAQRSAAGAIVAADGEALDGRNILRSDNPYLAFARAVDLLVPEEEPEPGVHPAAVVHISMAIAEGVSIGPLAVVEEGVEIGAGTRIFPRVTIHRGTRIGRRCVVQSGTVLGSDGFGYATDAAGQHHRVPQRGGLVIGDDVEIGANVTIDRGSIGDTVIGEGTKIDNLVHVGHNVRLGRNSIIVAQVGIAGSATIGDFAVLGGQAGIAGHVTIGDRVRIGGQTGVIGDIPPGGEVSGYPARPHREQMRLIGLIGRLPELFKRIKDLESERTR